MGDAIFTLLIDGAPADADLVTAVEQIEIDASLEEASAFRIRCGITKTALGDWSILEADPFAPLRPVSVLLGRGDAVPQTLINGYVAEERVEYSDRPGVSTLEISGLDVTSLMNVEEKITAWPNLSDSAIATTILGGYGALPLVDDTPTTLVEPDGTTIQRGSDARFLRRLARRNGFDFYVQPQPQTGIDEGHFAARDPSTLPQAVLSVSFGEQTNVTGFRIRYEMSAAARATAIGLDARTKEFQAAMAVAADDPPLGLLPTLLAESPAPLVHPADTGLPGRSELQRALQGMVNASSWSVLAEGTVGADVPSLRPGGLVNIRGCGRVHNGSYLVTRVQHLIEPGGYEQRFEARRNAVQMTGSELFVEVGP